MEITHNLFREEDGKVNADNDYHSIDSRHESAKRKRLAFLYPDNPPKFSFEKRVLVIQKTHPRK